jgi:ethanolamine phosphate transferase 2 subunit G
MLPKQREMDGIVREIYEAMEKYSHHEKTLLVLAGDHGMNAGGNHGGSGPGETEPALVFASPRFKAMINRREYECPTLPKAGTEFHYYTKIEQSDLGAALSSMMALPIPKNSLGVLMPELGGLWSDRSRLQLLLQNARQMLHIIRAKYSGDEFDRAAEVHSIWAAEEDYPCLMPEGDEETLVWGWGEVLHELNIGSDHTNSAQLEAVIYRFLSEAQDIMSDTASSYDVPRMVIGMAVASVALVLDVLAFPALWPPSLSGVFLTIISLLYGIMMFASSYVEEEQHFWYWLTPVWMTALVARLLGRKDAAKMPARIIIAGAVLLFTHRLAVRWNQTGQKHAGEPDTVHTFFPDHHNFMWLLVLATYLTNGYFLHNRTFAGLFMQEITAFVDVSLVFLGIVFKLNFTQADAPELVQELAVRIRQWSEPFSLVMQAQAIFATIGIAALAVIVLQLRQWSNQSGSKDDAISLHERLHHLLTLFLMTQTRAPNIPLFLALELQLQSLLSLTERSPANSRNTEGGDPPATSIAITTLLLSHVYYFCMGGSNSISSIDLSNAYNGVADYNIAAVGVLLFASNWAGPVWWCSAAVLLCTQQHRKEPANEPSGLKNEREWVIVEHEKLQQDALASTSTSSALREAVSRETWFVYVASMSTFIAMALVAVMAACTQLRTHLFIWTVFSPKYLYAMAWSLGWHLLLNIGLANLLMRLSRIR